MRHVFVHVACLLFRVFSGCLVVPQSKHRHEGHATLPFVLWPRVGGLADCGGKTRRSASPVTGLWLKHRGGGGIFSQPPSVSGEAGFCVFCGKKKTNDGTVELQSSVSLGTLRNTIRDCPPRRIVVEFQCLVSKEAE